MDTLDARERILQLVQSGRLTESDLQDILEEVWQDGYADAMMDVEENS